jgi:putative membrane protein
VGDSAAGGVVLAGAGLHRHGEIMKARFSKADLERIKLSIHRAEQNTSGEIVPLVVSSSDSYSWVHLIWVFAGWLGSTIWVLYISRRYHWDLTSLFGWQSIGMFIGGALSFVPAIKRTTVPQKWQQHQVHRQSLADFMGAGLANTRDRTGVLIYISNLERRVHILADKGIHDKVPANYWDNQVKEIVEGIRKGNFAVALAQVIEEIGSKLSTAFPRKTDDKNELPDTLQFGHRDQGDDA